MEELGVNDLEIGEFIRTKEGKIRKITAIDIHYGDVLIRNKEKDIIYNFEIVKHSKNIIDLIEVGDYVNGCKVYENRKTYLTVYQKVDNSEVDYNYINYNEIKSIVTKEMFKSIEYKVED